MGWQRWAPPVVVLLSTFVVTEVHAVTIHDVIVDGQTVPGSPASGPNCIDFAIGTKDGTTYTNMTIQGADGLNPARILAIENGQSCFGLTTSTRDRLILVNTRIIPITANVNLLLEYKGDFGPAPNGSVVFGGFMKGKFIKNNTGVSCTGNTPPNGPCMVIYDSWVFSNVDHVEHQLPEINSLNPIGGSFNITIPSNPAINVGTLDRTHHGRITVVLPSTAHRLEVKGSDSFVSQAVPPKKPHRPDGIVAPEAPKNP